MSANSISLHIFEVLATQHEPMLMSYLVSLVGDYALAEDVAQQSLVIASRKIHALKDPSAFPSWLRGIARLEGLAATDPAPSRSLQLHRLPAGDWPRLSLDVFTKLTARTNIATYPYVSQRVDENTASRICC